MKSALPAWLASITQVPAADRKATVPSEIEQSAVLDGSMLNVTDRPDVAVAVGV